MKAKYLAPALVVPALALTLLGVGTASAHGGFGGGMGFLTSDQRAQMHQTRFEKEAEILGVNVSEVKDAWAQGKGLKELATEKGISEQDLRTKMEANRKTEMQNHLKELVSSGVITQTQADQRLKFMETKQAEMKEKGMNEKGPRGGMMGHRFGGRGAGAPAAQPQQ